MSKIPQLHPDAILVKSKVLSNGVGENLGVPEDLMC